MSLKVRDRMNALVKNMSGIVGNCQIIGFVKNWWFGEMAV